MDPYAARCDDTRLGDRRYTIRTVLDKILTSTFMFRCVIFTYFVTKLIKLIQT